MFCRKCGKELPEGAGFCPECGNRTAAPQPAQNQPAQSQWQPSEAPKIQPSPKQTANTGSNTTADYTK